MIEVDLGHVADVQGVDVDQARRNVRCFGDDLWCYADEADYGTVTVDVEEDAR